MLGYLGYTRELADRLFALQNNLFRCILGAVVVSLQEPLRGMVGNGGLFTLFGSIMIAVVIPIVLVERKYGGRWRKARLERGLDSISHEEEMKEGTKARAETGGEAV